jgi:predicted permease
LALGACGGRLIRAMLTESVLLAVIGGALGLLVALDGSHAILMMVFHGAKFNPIDTAISWPILGFTLLVSLLTGILFGVAPAWIASRSNPADALRGATRATQDHSALPQKSLVVVQAALSLVLLAVAGLVTQSLRNLQSQSYGFARENRYIASIAPDIAGYKPEQLPQLYERLQEEVNRIPGVTSAALTMYAPQSGNNWSEGIFIEGHKRDPAADNGSSWDRVSPRFFETLGIPVLRGRTITEQDTPASRHVAVVNQEFVRKFYPNEDPMGRHFGRSDAAHAGDYEIVGVVGDTKYQEPTETARPMLFLPLLQVEKFKDPSDQTIEIRSEYVENIVLQFSGRPGDLEAQLRRTLGGINPDLGLLELHSYNEQISDNLTQETMISRLTSLFSILAVLLASIGLYGVTAYRVARRTSEIGIRMALGATSKDMVLMVLRGAFTQIGLGLLIGIPLAIGARRLLASKLFGIRSYDPLVLGGAVIVLGICAFFASVAPARKAAAVHPMEALRTE